MRWLLRFLLPLMFAMTTLAALSWPLNSAQARSSRPDLHTPPPSSPTLARLSADFRMQNPLPPRQAPVAAGPKSPRLSAYLFRLIQSDRNARAFGRGITSDAVTKLDPDQQGMVAAKQMRIDKSGRVQVYVQSGASVNHAVDDVSQVGGQVERTDEKAGLVQAWVPISALEELSRGPEISVVRLPDYGFPQAGSTTTQGDAILKADLARSSLAVDGTHIRVGVISDGVGGIGNSQAQRGPSVCQHNDLQYRRDEPADYGRRRYGDAGSGTRSGSWRGTLVWDVRNFVGLQCRGGLPRG
jgi:hypothetical protein